MKRNDLLTGQPFIAGRITQKFACAENRIKYWNQKANELNHSLMYITTPLKKNIQILNELMEGKDTKTFFKQFLLGKSYTFGVMTHYVEIEKKRIACVYQFSIQLAENDMVSIVRVKKTVS